jgi:hypothetical protein
MTGCMTRGDVMMKTHTRRLLFLFSICLKPTPNNITVTVTVPKYKVIKSYFILRNLYVFLKFEWPVYIIHWKDTTKYFSWIFTYKSEAPEMHPHFDDCSTTVINHWPNTLVICAQQVMFQPFCMWLHFSWIIVAVLSHYSWKLRVSQAKYELDEKVWFKKNLYVAGSSMRSK